MSCGSGLCGSYFESGRPVARVANDLGIGKEALRQWMRQVEADQGARPELLTTSERAELNGCARRARS
jgi:transposase